MRRPAAAALGVFFVLLATVDERSFGLIPDGQVMLSSGVALARFGEIGVSRDFVVAPERPGGDAVSRYGMALSLAEVVPAALARVLFRVAPGASSAPLFVLLPIGALAFAASLLARAALGLGASPRLAALGGAALVLATPLWAYAGSDTSEPLQVAAMAALLFAAASAASGDPAERKRALGLAAAALGVAALSKSILLLAGAPLVLAAVRATSPKERKSLRGPLVALGAGLGLWTAFELVRFGRLFGGYEGETFSYPPLSGLLRLTLFPNRGLFFYAPLLVLAPVGFLALRRRAAGLAWAAFASVAVVFASAAAWWAWDGQAGWGPRLVLPALPALVLFAVAAVASRPRLAPVALALGIAGAGVNLLGVLTPPAGLFALASAAPPRPISEDRARGTLYEVERGADGVLLASGPHHLSLTPSWSPIRLQARLLAARLGATESADVLWRDIDPPFTPVRPAFPGAAYRAATSPFLWPFWGRSWLAPDAGATDPYRLALRDQTIRALDLGKKERAFTLGSALARAPRPDPADVALAAEAALSLGRADEADRLLSASAEPCHPWVAFVELSRGRTPPCLPEDVRAGFRAGVEAARARGVGLTGWARAARGG